MNQRNWDRNAFRSESNRLSNPYEQMSRNEQHKIASSHDQHSQKGISANIKKDGSYLELILNKYPNEMDVLQLAQRA